MGEIQKLFAKLDAKTRKIIESIIKRILMNEFEGLDLKQLKNTKSVFRVRKGNIKVIFTKNRKQIRLLSVEKREKDTYKF